MVAVNPVSGTSSREAVFGVGSRDAEQTERELPAPSGLTDEFFAELAAEGMAEERHQVRSLAALVGVVFGLASMHGVEADSNRKRMLRLRR